MPANPTPFTLQERYKKIFQCDAVRVLQISGTYFLLIGFNRNTKDDSGQWLKNGEPFDFEYIKEKVIASGATYSSLHRSTLRYKAALDFEGKRDRGEPWTVEEFLRVAKGVVDAR